MSKTNRTGNRPSIVIKKEEVIEGGGHGGAWKVAYADFVTAMMAFFLLMWLLNATTEDQRKGLADYFSPNNQLSHASSGTGDPFGGHTAFDKGALVSDRGAVQAIDGTRPTPIDPSDPDAQPFAHQTTGPTDDQDQDAGPRTAPPTQAPPATAALGSGGPAAATAATTGTAAGVVSAAITAEAPHASAAASAAGATVAAATPTEQAGETAAPRQLQTVATAAQVGAPKQAQMRAPTQAELHDELEREEKAAFAQAAQQIRDAVRSDPALADLAHQLMIDITLEGLRIQLIDEDRQPMFPLGSAIPNDRAKLLLQKVTPVLAKLPQDISIAGHTDATPFPGPGRTNWELSAERANATRRLLLEGGLPESRIRSVTGNADRDLLIPNDPLAAANRRIAIVVLRSTKPASPGDAPAGAATPGSAPAGPAAAGVPAR